jgi:alanyl-tRNA synthetase
MAQEQGFQIDQTGFETEMSHSKQKAKASWKNEGATNIETYITAWTQDLLKKSGATEFVGYNRRL